MGVEDYIDLVEGEAIDEDPNFSENEENGETQQGTPEIQENEEVLVYEELDETENVASTEVETNDISTPGCRIGQTLVKKIVAPAVGMVFPTWEDLDDYYRSYGRQEGFGVVRAASAYRQVGGRPSKIKRNSTWKCDCGGNYVPRQTDRARKTSVGRKGLQVGVSKSKKCACPAMLYAALSEAGEWHIKKVVLEHENHIPTPSKTQYISMYRQEEFTNAVRKRLFNDVVAGVKVPQILWGLAKARNGLENMGLNERDLRNALGRERKLRLAGGDAKAMYAYFKRMSADNQNFFHMHRLDEFERLKDVLWVDARSRVAYQEFSDVVTFDSTYITNKFELPFANFVVVNHHGQSILLGCALISREDTETFEWVFSTWLSCMGGSAPKGILTDQDAAMRKPLSRVMSGSRHRWCLWHILKKFSKRLGAYANYKEIKGGLHRAIYDSITPEDFISNWNYAITKFELQDNDWLKGLFDNKEMWVPTYMKHMFWAGMKTTQRSESVNAFFDGYVKKNTRLYEFAQQYFSAMEKRAKAEHAADADSSRHTQQKVTDFPLEKVFQKLYTHSKFCELQVECVKTFYVHLISREMGNLSSDSDGGDEYEYFTLEDRIWVYCNKKRKHIPTRRRAYYCVKLKLSSKEAWCNCMHFESHGIMCRHIIKLYYCLNIEVVPEMYILDRWRKDIQRRHTRVKVAYHDPSKTEEVKRYDKMMVSFESLCLTASTDERDMEIVLDMLKQTVAKVKERCLKIKSDVVAADNMSPQPSVGKNIPLQKQSLGDGLVSPGVQESHVPTPSSRPTFTPSPNNTFSTPCTPMPHTTSLTQTLTRDYTPSPTNLFGTPSTPMQDTVNLGNDKATPNANISPVIKDPPLKKKSHRTTDKRFLCCTEKSKAKGAKRKGATMSKSPATDTELVTPKRTNTSTSSQTQTSPNQGNLCHPHGGLIPMPYPLQYPAYCSQPYVMPMMPPSHPPYRPFLPPPFLVTPIRPSVSSPSQPTNIVAPSRGNKKSGVIQQDQGQ